MTAGTSHEPECPALDDDQPDRPVRRDNCYCDRLQAAVARGRAAQLTREDKRNLSVLFGYERGHADALAEARSAINATRQPGVGVLWRDDVIAAITALRQHTVRYFAVGDPPEPTAQPGITRQP